MREFSIRAIMQFVHQLYCPYDERMTRTFGISIKIVISLNFFILSYFHAFILSYLCNYMILQNNSLVHACDHLLIVWAGYSSTMGQVFI